jgi:membrane fusion protein, multidrug efflux system
MRAIIILVLIIAVFSSGCRNTTVKPTTKEVTSVRLMEVIPETISLPVHSTGTVVSSEEIKLSFKTGGIISEINVREGQKVKKGAILAALNLSEINAQVNIAGNGFEKATRDFNRVKNLYRDSVATLEQFQNARTVLDMAKTSLDVAVFNQSHSTIIAPEDGVILKQFAKASELIASGYPVFLFGTYGKNWKVKTSLSDRDIVKINQGDSASVKLDAWPGVNFSAVVDQVGEMSNPMTGTYEVEMTLAKTSYRLSTGFIADATVYPQVHEKYLMIPVGSLVDSDGQEGFIFTVSDSMVATKQRVEIIAVIGSRVAIKGDAGSIKRIVTEGAAYLRDGERVKVVE